MWNKIPKVFRVELQRTCAVHNISGLPRKKPVFLPSFQTVMQGQVTFEKTHSLYLVFSLYTTSWRLKLACTRSLNAFVLSDVIRSRRAASCTCGNPSQFQCRMPQDTKRINIQLSWQCALGLIIYNTGLTGEELFPGRRATSVTQIQALGYCIGRWCVAVREVGAVLTWFNIMDKSPGDRGGRGGGGGWGDASLMSLINSSVQWAVDRHSRLTGDAETLPPSP